ncbi:hypothetical protein K491DRAFT_690865 [Lophiostoma macrostomum CBS 122681]|uniref:Uncharacterized protein n=1 Tax=Lophiostoma macrostomum CBS 122681 TaxID=1314788 RepID=A0A6A6TF70_9PLEO|nr:hypothetical protein K491DRAFT_690865 [Lophiostoma macrostomum CBS 122681]
MSEFYQILRLSKTQHDVAQYWPRSGRSCGHFKRLAQVAALFKCGAFPQLFSLIETACPCHDAPQEPFQYSQSCLG